jgi:nucleotide-binding universal stress UspA family protein
MFKKVLFPTDFSGCSTKITDFAIRFALNNSSELIFFHVLNNEDDDATVDYSQFKNEVEVKLDDLDKKSELLEIENVKNLKWDIVTVYGSSAAEEIVKYVEEEKNGIEIILMPTHGTGGLKRFLIGSTAEKVVRHSLIPVLTINTSKLAK